MKKVTNELAEQPLELLNLHHTLDTYMYQGMKMLQGDQFTEKIKMPEGRQFSLSSHHNPNKISAKAYIWGFHIVIPEKPLQELYKAADITAALNALIGAGFGAGGVPPAAIVIGFLVGILEVEKAVIQAIDRGKGVYLSWSWLQVPAMSTPPFVGIQPIITPIKH